MRVHKSQADAENVFNDGAANLSIGVTQTRLTVELFDGLACSAKGPFVANIRLRKESLLTVLPKIVSWIVWSCRSVNFVGSSSKPIGA